MSSWSRVDLDTVPVVEGKEYPPVVQHGQAVWEDTSIPELDKDGKTSKRWRVWEQGLGWSELLTKDQVQTIHAQYNREPEKFKPFNALSGKWHYAVNGGPNSKVLPDTTEDGLVAYDLSKDDGSVYLWQRNVGWTSQSYSLQQITDGVQQLEEQAQSEANKRSAIELYEFPKYEILSVNPIESEADFVTPNSQTVARAIEIARKPIIKALDKAKWDNDRIRAFYLWTPDLGWSNRSTTV